MRIHVCIKRVPDTAANIKIVGERAFDESIKFVMNPYDEYALEQAVKTAEIHGGEVVAVSLGKADGINTVRSALAVGAHRGILITADQGLLDPKVTAEALAAAIRRDGGTDLIFTGKQSVDTEAMQTHYHLAAAMAMPIANDVVSFSLKPGGAVVECQRSAGRRDTAEIPLPCVIGCSKGLNVPRQPKLPDILKAKKKPVQEIALSDLTRESEAAALWELLRLEPFAERGRADMLSGDMGKMVDDLITALNNKAVL